VEGVLHADSFGPSEQKIKKYEALVTQRTIQYGGFKLIHEQHAQFLSL
jgi:hypothetical protein